MRDLDRLAVRRVRDRKRPLVEPLHQHAISAAVVEQNLDLIAASAPEYVQVAALRITRQLLAHQGHQSGDLPSHVAGASVQEHTNLPIQADHRPPSSAWSHGAIAAASQVPANVTTRPFGNVTSTRRWAASVTCPWSRTSTA